MKIEINKYVAPQLYSSNFPGRDLAPDIAGFINLFCLQIENIASEMVSRRELLEYLSSSLKECIRGFEWIFEPWEHYIESPSDKKTIEIGYEYIKPCTKETATLFNIHIEFVD